MEPRTLSLLCSCLDRVINNRGGKQRLRKSEHEELRRILTPHKRQLKRIMAKTTTDQNRRKVLKQHGGAVASIIATLVPLLISSFSKLFK